MEEIIIDGVDVAGCEYMLNNKIKGKQHCPVKAMPYAKETSCICRKSIDTPYNFCKHNPNCHYKQLKRLEQENARLKENDCEQCKHLDLYIKYKQTMQEIKSIAETELSYDMVGNEHRHYKNYDIIRHLITKAEEE